MLRATDPMSLAGAGVMSGYWRDAYARRLDVRAGVDPEAVHDMRVGIRRLRVALALFARWYPEGEVRALRRELRRLARRLGAARDSEVLIADARAAAAQLPGADMEGLLARWQAQHAAARLTLLEYLDSVRFRRLARGFEEFLERQRAQPGLATGRVCDVMPAEVWRRYGAVHAFDPIVGSASLRRLHRLRIAGKQLRYVLESFQTLLGEDRKRAIAVLRELQDVLGAMHDADLAVSLLEEFLATGAGPSDRIEPYLEQQRSVLVASRARFQAQWPALCGDSFREDIAAAALALAGS